MSIESIKNELNQERADLVAQMIGELKRMDEDFNMRTG